MTAFLLAIDQGTTSSRAILFDDQSHIVAVAQTEFNQYFPADGWVEHDANEIWQTTCQVVTGVISKAGIPAADIAAIGITNQRETTVIWDRATGDPVHPAIVWQDRRTADFCDDLVRQGFEPVVTAKTGLILDPYFSATKVNWLLDNVDGVRHRAEQGDLAFGTIDSFLLWKLTGGSVHKTDATNASRTMLFNIHDQCWDPSILSRLNIPAALMPEVEDSAADFGVTDPTLFGAGIPIRGIAGDQQAALFGQCCFEPGMTKSTYGTGCFVIMNTGSEAVVSGNRLLTTVGYRIGGEVTYGLEGSIFMAGAAVQWLRDELGIIRDASETEALASDSRGVYLVPAFTGLGAPYWDANARGALVGLSRDSGIREIVTATLQSVCFQSRDLIEAMARDGADPSGLRIDGGMIANDWVAQCLADILRLPVQRPRVIESTALGVTYLAGLQTGVYSSMDAIAETWQLEHEFQPQMSESTSDALYSGWVEAVSRVRTHD